MRRNVGTAARIGAGLAVVVLAGCGGSDSSPAPAARNVTTRGAGTPPTPAKPKPAGATLKTDYNNDYGRLLVDGRGHTLYLFAKEKSGRSECSGACATAWPPFLTKYEPQAADGAAHGKLGTTKRSDGATQVTYNGHPLYFYNGEKAAGQVLCQNVDEFGGKWLIVAPSGNPIQ